MKTSSANMIKYLSIILFCMTMLAQEPIVHKISVIGNTHFTDKEVLSMMSTKEIRFWSVISNWLLGSAPRFVPFVFRQDLSRIRDAYISAGYIDAEVRSNVTPVRDGDRVMIDVLIEEKLRYEVRNIYITGDDTLFYMGKRRRLQLSEGSYFNPGKLRDDRRFLNITAQNRGYPYVDAVFTVDTIPPNFIDVKYQITQGKFAWFGDVHLRSNTGKIDSATFRREVVIKKGEPYNYNKVRTTQENLYQTQLFDIVRIQPEDFDMTPDTLDFTINVFEKKANWVGGKLGFITEPTFDMQTDITGEYGNRHILGKGRSITARAITSFAMINDWDNLKHRYELEYSAPWVLSKKLPIVANVYYEPKNATLTDEYVIRRYGGRLSASYRYRQHYQHLLSVSLTKVDLLDIVVDDATQLTRDIETVERNISYAFELDRRSNVLNPKSGSVFRFTNQFAGWILSGDEHYNKSEIFWAQYHGIFKESVFAWRVNTGYIVQLEGDRPIAAHNRYYLGGNNTVRGFQERSMGPVVDDKPSGGKYYLLSSAELRMPIIWIVGWQAFVDAGQLWEDFDKADLSQIQASAGLGLSLNTPFGPIRFDYGFQVINPREDYSNTWHLSILYAY